MKNIQEKSLKKAITMPLQEFKLLTLELTDENVEFILDGDGSYFTYTEKGEENEKYLNLDYTNILSEYFDTTVTSVHCDGMDFDYPLVWIVYK